MERGRLYQLTVIVVQCRVAEGMIVFGESSGFKNSYKDAGQILVT